MVVKKDLNKEMIKISNGGKETKLIEIILSKKNQLIETIKKEYEFNFVDFQTVFYPNNNNRYTTIEVVSKNQPERQHFINPKNIRQSKKPKPDLINKMMMFEEIAIKLIFSNKLNLKNQSCPVYHCINGFSHPQLKPYLKIFNDRAIKEKKLIMDTLNKDSNPERRAAAAFLMGHFSSPREIITLLSSHVDDSDDAVRNNMMRVIAATMEKAKINQINIRPFLSLLDSPYATDRDKALYVLSTAVESNSSKKLLIQKGSDKLLALLQLK